MARRKVVILVSVLMALTCCQRVLAEGKDQVEEPVVYKGKVRSPHWIDEQYERFKDKIAKVDGRYYLGLIKVNSLGKPLMFLPEVPSKGRIFYLERGRILTVLSPNSALVHIRPSPAPFSNRGGIEASATMMKGVAAAQAKGGYGGIPESSPRVKRDKVYQIVGISTEGWVTDQPFSPCTVVVTGTHEYRSADGRKRTVARVEPIRTLAREQFVEALKQGIELKRWICEEVRCPKCQGRGKVRQKRGRPGRFDTCRRCKGIGRVKEVRLDIIP